MSTKPQTKARGKADPGHPLDDLDRELLGRRDAGREFLREWDELYETRRVLGNEKEALRVWHETVGKLIEQGVDPQDWPPNPDLAQRARIEDQFHRQHSKSRDVKVEVFNEIQQEVRQEIREDEKEIFATAKKIIKQLENPLHNLNDVLAVDDRLARTLRQPRRPELPITIVQLVEAIVSGRSFLVREELPAKDEVLEATERVKKAEKEHGAQSREAARERRRLADLEERAKTKQLLTFPERDRQAIAVTSY